MMSSERTWSARPPGRQRSFWPEVSASCTADLLRSLLSGAQGLTPPQRCTSFSLLRTLRENSPSENHSSMLQEFAWSLLRAENSLRTPSMADQ